MKTLKDKLESYFLEWLNDFLTIERFAEYHGMEQLHAQRLIKLGRKVHYRKNSICYVCNGRGNHIETVVESYGNVSRVRIPCMNCNGSGKVVSK